MANVTNEWKDKISEKLVSMFGDDLDTLAQILSGLDQAYSEPKWKALKLLFHRDNSFKLFAERIADEEATKEKLSLILSSKFQRNENHYEDTDGQGFQSFAFKTESSFDLSEATRFGLISGGIVAAGALGIAGSVGSVTMIGLAAVYLSVDAMINIRKYWNGEISGKRCCKNIFDTTFMVAGSFAGGVGGAIVGSLAGPVGTLVGAVAGGILTAQAMSFFSERLTETLFGVPKSIALENAYNFFGLKMTASAREINTVYRQMCLQHHPDKGGKSEDFLEVQLNMAIIKVAFGCL